MLWSYKLKFKIWARSNQWLLRYSTINILRLSSNLGRLPWEVIFMLCICKLCFGHISLSLKFEQDPISGCWDIPLSIFWGCLPIKVVFHGRSSSFYAFVNFALVCLGHISLSLKFEHDLIRGCWDIPLWIFWGCLSIMVIFHGRSSSFYAFVEFALVCLGHIRLSFKFEQDLIRGCWDIPFLIFGHLSL